MSPRATHAVSPVDLFSEEVLRDPYPTYAQLRALGPAVWLSHEDVWALPRYAPVWEVQRHPEFFSSVGGPGLVVMPDPMMTGVILSTDPRAHADSQRRQRDARPPSAAGGQGGHCRPGPDPGRRGRRGRSDRRRQRSRRTVRGRCRRRPRRAACAGTRSAVGHGRRCLQHVRPVQRPHDAGDAARDGDL